MKCFVIFLTWLHVSMALCISLKLSCRFWHHCLLNIDRLAGIQDCTVDRGLTSSHCHHIGVVSYREFELFCHNVRTCWRKREYCFPLPPPQPFLRRAFSSPADRLIWSCCIKIGYLQYDLFISGLIILSISLARPWIVFQLRVKGKAILVQALRVPGG